MHGRETFIVRAADGGAAPDAARGDWVWVDPDEPAESATIVRLMVVEDGRRVLRALDEGFPDIAVTRENETMIRCGAVFVGHGVRRARAPSLPGLSQEVLDARRRMAARRGNPVVTGRGRRREPCGGGRVPANSAGDPLMMPV